MILIKEKILLMKLRKRDPQVKTSDGMVSDDVVIESNVTPPVTVNDSVISNARDNYPVDNNSLIEKKSKFLMPDQSKKPEDYSKCVGGRRRVHVKGGVFAGPAGQF